MFCRCVLIFLRCIFIFIFYFNFFLSEGTPAPHQKHHQHLSPTPPTKKMGPMRVGLLTCPTTVGHEHGISIPLEWVVRPAVKACSSCFFIYIFSLPLPTQVKTEMKNLGKDIFCMLSLKWLSDKLKSVVQVCMNGITFLVAKFLDGYSPKKARFCDLLFPNAYNFQVHVFIGILLRWYKR